jgi:hypothetical protein
MRLLLTAHLGVTPTCAEARVRIPLKVASLSNTNKPPIHRRDYNMWLSKRKLTKRIERMMIEQEIELHGLDSQHSRAYHTGMIDGLGMALFAVSPPAARRNPISIVWFDEDYDEPRQAERDRESIFDATNATMFESVEAR